MNKCYCCNKEAYLYRHVCDACIRGLSVSRAGDCSAWEVDYDMFERDDYTKKDKIAQRLNDGWVEMGMLPWIVEGKHAGFHAWWKRQNEKVEAPK